MKKIIFFGILFCSLCIQSGQKTSGTKKAGSRRQ